MERPIVHGWENSTNSQNVEMATIPKEKLKELIDYSEYAETKIKSNSDEIAKKIDEHDFTGNDVDGAYFLGVFNASGIDGLSNELERIKKLGFKPHQFLNRIKTKQG